MRKYWNLMAVYYRSSLLVQMEYRANFWSSIAISLMWPVWHVLAIAIFFYHRPTLGGWSFNEVLLVVGLFDVFAGIMELILVPNVRQVVDHIQKGTLDFVLLKPADSQFLATTTACSPLRVLDIVLGFGFIAAGLYRLGRVPTVSEFLTFSLMLPTGFVIIYSMWLLLTTLAFWWVRVDNFTELFYSFYEAGRFPISVYTGWVRFVLTFVVPIAFLTTFPAATLLGRLSLGYVAGAMFMAAGLLYASNRFWKYAIRFYSSASS